MNDHQKKEKIKYLLLIHELEQKGVFIQNPINIHSDLDEIMHEYDVALLTHEKNQKKLEKEKITMTFLLGLSYIEYLSR